LAKNNKRNIKESVNSIGNHQTIMSSVIDTINVSEFDGNGLEIIGTDGFNALNGTERGDYIEARGAGDFVDARKGNDLIDAGMGDDFVHAGNGSDSVLGGGGQDVIFGGKGADVVISGEGNDVIIGGMGDDYLMGSDGDDTIFGGAGNDTLNGGIGNDLLFGGSGSDVFEFAVEDLDAQFINRVGDFSVGEDIIMITGLSDQDQTNFDPNSGYLSVNGDTVVSLQDLGNSADLKMEFNDDGEFEIM